MAEKRAKNPIIEAYKKNIDRTLIRENLKLTPTPRLEKLQELQEFAKELCRAGKMARIKSPHSC